MTEKLQIEFKGKLELILGVFGAKIQRIWGNKHEKPKTQVFSNDARLLKLEIIQIGLGFFRRRVKRLGLQLL